MIKILSTLFVIQLLVASCKKSYTCECTYSRRGMVFLPYQQSYRAKNKQKAQDNCYKDYRSMADDAADATCEIK